MAPRGGIWKMEDVTGLGRGLGCVWRWWGAGGWGAGLSRPLERCSREPIEERGGGWHRSRGLPGRLQRRATLKMGAQSASQRRWGENKAVEKMWQIQNARKNLRDEEKNMCVCARVWARASGSGCVWGCVGGGLLCYRITTSPQKAPGAWRACRTRRHRGWCPRRK